MSGRSVVRLLGALVRSALFAAPLIFLAAASAQQPDAPKPSDTPASSGDAAPPAPAPSPDLKTKLGRAPKDVPLIDPCKSAHPPSYCNVKD